MAHQLGQDVERDAGVRVALGVAYLPWIWSIAWSVGIFVV
jgi:hypothetical protein